MFCRLKGFRHIANPDPLAQNFLAAVCIANCQLLVTSPDSKGAFVDFDLIVREVVHIGTMSYLGRARTTTLHRVLT